MLELQEIILKSDDVLRRVTALHNFLDVDNCAKRISELELKMAASNFWDNQESARVVIDELNILRDKISGISELKRKVVDFCEFLQIVRQESCDDLEMISACEKDLVSLEKQLDCNEITAYLSGKLDRCNAILSIHAGAGGTESCDWAEMLFRMYTRWAERNGFKTTVEDFQDGEGAGVSHITMLIEGRNAYGYAKAERGVHRLVRISPFDANKRRHTSFASVDVIAEITDDATVEIDDKDLRIDTYRSSGKGGQHVNKTESAIRITHIPSGIVVTCQNERSQIKNKETAMRTLRSRLYEKIEDEKRSEMEKFYGPKGEIGWGNQIRSYVFQPYQMVKDLRTGVESGNIQAIMDGDIDQFIHGWLKAGCPSERKS